METIKKRLKVFENLNMPVVEHYSLKGKVHKVLSHALILD
jgi:UMP-CMP kinase